METELFPFVQVFGEKWMVLRPYHLSGVSRRVVRVQN